MQFTATVMKVLSRWGHEKSGVTARIKIAGEGGEIGLIGIQIDQVPISHGITYLFEGKRVEHEKYGDQINFEAYVVTTPSGKAGVVSYLQQAEGVGPQRAVDLWELYGDDSVSKVREHPKEVAKDTSINIDRLREASLMFRELEEHECVTIELMAIFDKTHIRKSVIAQLITEYRTDAAIELRANPYMLMRFKGIGFIKTDRLAMSLGFDPRSITRHMYAIVWAVQYEQREGHVWHDIKTVRESLRNTIGDARMDEGIEFGLREDWLATREVDGRACVALRSQALAEYTISQDVARILGSPNPMWGNHSTNPDLTLHQRESLAEATIGKFCLFTGGPGTGKTYTAAQVVEHLQALGVTISICAPTGKAAKRCTQAMRDEGVKGITATTIHSLLGVDKFEHGEFIFKHRRGIPLPANYILVDEASMVDNILMSRLLEAVPDNGHVMLIGDPQQLSPVSPGFPLRDLRDSPHVPGGELTEIRRNSGQIVECCTLIRTEQTMSYSKEIDEDVDENLAMFKARDPASQIAALCDIMDELQNDGIGLINETVILTPKNSGNEITRQPLNKFLQGGLNPNGHSYKGNPFRVGDPVVCLSNHSTTSYEWLEDNRTWARRLKTYAVNGEQGSVVDVQKKFAYIMLDDQKTIRASVLAPDKVERWDLGYALTCHKAQGSEWPAVIVILDDSVGGKMVSSRNWIYTALSRAKRRCYLIGTRGAVYEMIRKDSTYSRRTDLMRELECKLSVETV